MGKITSGDHKGALGQLEMIMGPMFSGKTTRLIEAAERLAHDKQVVCLKPALDNRYDYQDLATHDRRTHQASILTEVAELQEYGKDFDVLLIDEVQFFPDEILPIIQSLLKQNKRIIVAGLDLDAFGIPFPSMVSLVSIADSIVQCEAKCAQCGAPATRTYKKGASTTRIEVGGEDLYEPRCASCYENGVK